MTAIPSCHRLTESTQQSVVGVIVAFLYFAIVVLFEIKRHLARSLKIYAERRSYIADLLRAELAEFVSFRLPEFGLAIWLELSPSINMLRLQADAALEKVGFIPANYYSSSEHQVSAIRLGYANLNEAEMRLGIQRLKTALMSQKSQLLRA